MIHCLGHPIDAVRTSTEGPAHDPGTVVWVKGKAYKYVKNGESSALTVNKAVVYSTAADDGTTVLLPASAGLMNVAGVTRGAIPASGYGWIQVHGYGTVDFDGAGTDAAAGQPIQTYGSAGKVQGVDTTVAAQVAAGFGIALDAETTDASLEVFLRGLV